MIPAPLTLINALRATDPYIEVIYTQGSCFQFHTFLLTFFPDGKPWMSDDKDHVVTEINGSLYDITGVVEPDGYYPCSPDDLAVAQTWSFSRTRLLSLGECPSCDEPLIA